MNTIESHTLLNISVRIYFNKYLDGYKYIFQMEGMVSSTPAGEDEAEKTLMQRVADAEESRQNKLRRMSRDLKVMIGSLQTVCH